MAQVDESPFGRLLRRFRLNAGLSQEELAERSGVSLAAIGALERGARQSPYSYTINQLATVLELSPEETTAFNLAARRHRKSRVAAAAPTISTISKHGETHPRPRTSISILPPFTGRQREFAWLERQFEQWAPLLLMSGEPGIGKTRLVQEVRSWARQRGWRVLWGNCESGSGQEPFAPIIDALNRYLAHLPREERSTNLKDCTWLTRLLPELAGEVAPPATSYEISEAHEQNLVFAAVEQFLANIALQAGTLLILDDLQWAGADTLQLITRLLHGAGPHRIRILAAYRSTAVKPGQTYSTFLAEMAREQLVNRCALLPLESQDAAALASALLHGIVDDANQEESALVIRKLVERTGGVPFYLVSCARELQTKVHQRDQQAPEKHAAIGASSEAGDAPPPAVHDPLIDLASSVEVPWNVAQSVEGRIALLPPAAEYLLAAAAVVGQPASGSLLTYVAELSESEALLGLEAACQAGLLVEDTEEGTIERYGIAHALIREVIASGLIGLRRRKLHARVAEALERELETLPERAGSRDRLISQLAYHYAHTNVLEKAVTYLRQAGDQARHRYAHMDAASYYRELATYADRIGHRRESARARWDLAMELIRVGALGEEILKPLEEAEQIYHGEGDVEARALVSTTIGYVHTASGMFDKGLDVVRPMMRSLRGAEGEHTSTPEPLPVSPQVRAELQGALSHLSFMAGFYDDALGLARNALDAAISTQDEGLIAHARVPLGVALLSIGQTRDAAENLVLASKGAEAAGDLATHADALCMLSWAYQIRGEFAPYKEAIEAATVLARKVNDGIGLGQSIFLEALLAYYLGDWQQAKEIGAGSMRAFQGLSASYLSAYPLLGFGWLSMVEGDYDTADVLLAQAADLAEHSGGLQVLRFLKALLSERDLLAGQPAAARARLDPLFNGPPLQERTRVELNVLRAWAALQLGDDADADDLITDSVLSAHAHEMTLVLPDALRIQALWAMQQRNWQQAEAALEDARTCCQTMPYPYAEARVLFVYGQVQAAKGEPERAHALWQEALAICEKLGERLYAERIEEVVATLQP
jgi:transcriptional regulator with XRE-family HTH domain/tetratricopeptide (TPR) repeat protein